MKQLLYRFFLFILTVSFFAGCQSQKEKIRALLEKECNCESVDVATLQTKKKEKILSYTLNNPNNPDIKAEVQRLIYVVQHEEPDFCATDKKIVFQFKTKENTKIYSFTHCVPKEEQ